VWYGNRRRMSSGTDSLWRRSAGWRWLTASAALSSAIVILARPWAGGVPGYLPPMARFDPSIGAPTPSAPAQATAVPVTPNTGPNQLSSGLNSIQAADHYRDSDILGTTPMPKTLNEAGAYLPPVKSRVVWSNKSGSVSGAGLIVEFCCAGPSSTTLANTPVRKGRHYWEVTLSVQPGEPRMGSNTNVGVGVEPAKSDPGQGMEGYFEYQMLMDRATLLGGDPTFVRVIAPRNNEIYQNGDVFMFALDADSNAVYYGVNGIWLNGEPGQQGGTQIGKRGDALIPFVTLSGSSKNAPVGDRWIANFGNNAFRFPIPVGYGAYGTYAPVTAKAENGLVIASRPVARPQPAAAGGFVNATFQDDFEFDDRRIPLPEGNWLGLAVARDAPGFPKGTLGILGKLKNGRVAGMVVVSPTARSSSGQPTLAGCTNPDNLVSENRASQAQNLKRCWWIHYGYIPWPVKTPFDTAEMTAQAHGAIMPAFFVTAGFTEDNGTTQKTVTYYLDPQEEGMHNPGLGQTPDQWRRDVLQSSPDRLAFIEKIEDWARGWAPIVFAYR
jgi:hypothetical protein